MKRCKLSYHLLAVMMLLALLLSLGMTHPPSAVEARATLGEIMDAIRRAIDFKRPGM